METTNKKDLNFEVNLLPVISVLAVCICALITVAVWQILGSIELKQASGAVGLLTDRTPVAVVSLNGKTVEIKLKNSDLGHRVSWSVQDPKLAENMTRDLGLLRKQVQGLSSAIVLSAKDISYQRIVSTLEVLKTVGFSQVGLSSL